MKRAFDFFIFSSLFIACCAVLMAWQTAYLFGLPVSSDLLWFVFTGTVSSYNFHWYLTPPKEEAKTVKLRWTFRNRTVHLVLFLAGIAASLFVFFRLYPSWVPLLFSVVLAFLYSAPKVTHPLLQWLSRIAVGKTIFLSAAWTYVTAMLPFLLFEMRLTDNAVLFVVNRFFFIYGICILFDYRDRRSDRRQGIRSLVTWLNERGINRLFWGTMVTTLATTGLFLLYFPLPVVLALGIPVLLLSLLYPSSKRNFSDYRYYFVLDGLMMLSAPLLILHKFAG